MHFPLDSENCSVTTNERDDHDKMPDKNVNTCKGHGHWITSCEQNNLPYKDAFQIYFLKKFLSSILIFEFSLSHMKKNSHLKITTARESSQGVRGEQ